MINTRFSSALPAQPTTGRTYTNPADALPYRGKPEEYTVTSGPYGAVTVSPDPEAAGPKAPSA